MKIGVCIKQVPATDSRIRVQPDGSGIVTDDIKWVVNPYDEFALEAALQLKDAGHASSVVLLTVDGPSADARIREGLARGADSAIRLDDPAFAGSDALGIARILAAAVRKEGIDVVLCGRQAVDDDQAQVPAMLAELLGWPQVTVIEHLEYDGEAFTVHKAVGGGDKQVIRVGRPVVLSADKGLNTPRFANLKGIMMAKRKKIQVLGAADLGLGPDEVGADAARLEVLGLSEPPPRPPGRIIQGETVEERVRELVRLLREEAKVI